MDRVIKCRFYFEPIVQHVAVVYYGCLISHNVCVDTEPHFLVCVNERDRLYIEEHYNFLY
jgi:hypothetical protein